MLSDSTPALARLTDSAPVLVKICAWCADFDPRDPANKGATHICCAACIVKALSGGKL